MWEAIAAGLVSKAAEKGISGAFDTAFLRRQNKIALGQQQELNKIETNQLMRNTVASVQALKNANLNPALMGGPSTSGNASGVSNEHANLDAASAIEAANLIASRRIIKAQSEVAEQQAEQQKIKTASDRIDLDNKRDFNDNLYLDNIINVTDTEGNTHAYKQRNKVSYGVMNALLQNAEFKAQRNGSLVNALKSQFEKDVLDTEDGQQKFTQALIGNLDKMKNEGKLSDLHVSIEEVNKKIKELDWNILEHTNLLAFLDKKNKTWSDWALFFGSVIIQALHK